MKLSRESFSKASKFIKNNAIGPDIAMYEYLFENGNKENVLNELEQYQNEDGGFGGLEFDFELYKSSGMATLKAFQYFRLLGANSNHEMIKKGIEYFLKISDEKSLSFPSVPPEVNNVPHAPWWSYNLPKQIKYDSLSWMELVEKYDPNTNSEITAYLIRYKDLIPLSFPIESFKKIALDCISKFDEKVEMHGFKCYIKLWEVLCKEEKDFLKSKLEEIITNIIERKREKWSTYCAQPLTLIDSPNLPGANLIKEDININLDYIIQNQDEDGSWSPNWSWGGEDNEVAWQRAKIKWQGNLTLNNLITLSKFGRIE